ncbi:MAG: FliH/SctL family protein [Planctomycetota bacterium]
MENEPRGHDLPAENEPDERTIAEARLELESLRKAYDDLMGQLRVEGEEQQRRLQVARDAERERIATQIEEANAKAAKIRQQALVECESLRKEATEEGRRGGYELGYEEGVQRGLEESRRIARENTEKAAREILGESCGTVPAMLNECLGDFDRVWRGTVGEMRRDTVALSRGIAERILRREIDRLPQLVLENIEVAIQRISDRRRLCIEVHPADLEAVIEFLPELGKRIRGAEAAEVIGHEAIHRGGCRVKGETGHVDLCIDTQLDLIESALIRNTRVSG